MNGNLTRFGLAVITLAVFQTLALGWIIAGRISILRSPDVVTLKTQPLDPRDLFRGDYVVLAYGISRLPLDGLPSDKDLKQGDTVYVEIAPAKDSWRAVGVWRKAPHPAGGDKVIRGRIAEISRSNARVRATPFSRDMQEVPCNDCVMASVTYGIESYFVPEGDGRKLEADRNAQSLSVDVALAGNGEAAIKGVRVDGDLLYEEPLL